MTNKTEATSSTNVLKFPAGGKINTAQVKRRRALRGCDVQPKRSEDRVSSDIVDTHTAEPIKSLDDIRKVCNFLLEHERYRDYMLFVVGINFGLRVSDLVRLRFSDLLDDDLQFRDSFELIEQKTSNTRTRKKNRYIAINDAVMDAVELYLEHNPNVYLDDYLFRSNSNRGMNSEKPIDRSTVWRILNGISKDCNLGIQFSTHSLRKTFGYHQMVMSGNDPRKLLLLQKIFGHSSVEETLCYIGITRQEIDQAYNNLNLGGVDYSTVPVEITSVS